MTANPNRLTVSGNLELTLVDISFKIAGRMTDRLVDEGDRVKAGAVIARLDPVQLKRQASRDRAIISSAQSSYDQLVTSVAFQRATLEADIAARKADLAAAQARLDALTNGSRPQDIKQTEAGVGDARAQLEFARLDWERAQTLFKNGRYFEAAIRPGAHALRERRTSFAASRRTLLADEGRSAAGRYRRGPRGSGQGRLGRPWRPRRRIVWELQRKEEELVARRG